MAIASMCGCGQVLVGNTVDALLTAAAKHVAAKHPKLVGTLSPLELAQPRKAIRRAA